MAQIKQTGLSPGGRYKIQVRARSKGDNKLVSEWSNVFSFTTTNDIVAPDEPTGITFDVDGSSFIAKWVAPTHNEDGSRCTDLKGYFVRFTNTDNTNQMSGEIFTVAPQYNLSFEENTSIFGNAVGNLQIEVRSVDIIGNKSSAAASAVASNPRPADVTGLTATPGLESVSLLWDMNTVDSDLLGYEVYVGTTSDFTPGPSNLKYFGQGTAFTLPTANPVEHFFKVRAVDIFRLGSQNWATASATPRSGMTTDGTPPGPVTAVTLTGSNDGTSSSVRVAWTAPTDLDIDRYVVRYATNQTNWSYITVPGDQTSVQIPNLKPNTAYYIAIQVWDYAGNKSGWTNAPNYPYTTPRDTTAPVKPATPTVATGAGRVQVSHTMKTSTNTNLPTDMDYLEVHVGPDAAFTPSATTSIGQISYVGAGVAVNRLFTYLSDTNSFWKVIAVDTSGNKSPASDAVQGNPGLITGAFIAEATITDANIADLSAAKLSAGSAFINDLLIRSKLTIDNANGSIESDDYNDANRTGWRINREGITINDGTVRARVLEIQDGINMMPPQYALFEFNDEFYFDSNGVASVNLVPSVNTVRFARKSNGVFGTPCLNVKNTGAHRVQLRPTTNTYPIHVNGEQPYIVSMHVRNNTSTQMIFEFGITFNDGEVKRAAFYIDPGTWARVPLAAQSTATAIMGAHIWFGTTTTTATDYDVDGIQLERQIGAVSAPSQWKTPGGTSINGSSIITGSIRSSAPAIGIPGQPAWSLNTQGNLQVGDALVRGSLVVGAGVDTSNSAVKSSDYLAGVSGWIVKGDGSVEFNKGTFRGALNIERTTNGVVTSLIADQVTQKMFVPNASIGEVNTNTPMLSGQHYQFDRALSPDGGWYLPTVPNPNKPMKYFLGPTTERSLVMQVRSDNDPYLVTGSLDSYPSNINVTQFRLGDYIDYRGVPREVEYTGYRLETSATEITGNGPGKIPYVYTRGDTNGGNPWYPSFITQNLLEDQGFLRAISPFAPEYIRTDDAGELTTVYDKMDTGGFPTETTGTRYLGVRTVNSTFQKNLLRSPYCDTVHGTLTFNGQTVYNDLVGTGAGQVTLVANSGSAGITSALEPIMHSDSNYKTPSYIVRWSVGANTPATMYLTNSMSGTNSGAWSYYVHSIRRGKRYILSVYIRTDYPGSTVSGEAGPPTVPFNLTMGLRCKTTSTGYQDFERAVTVQPNKTSRVSVAIDIPTGTPELDQAIMYFRFPGMSVLNRRIVISHPQVEEKAWANHPNPKVAASNAPTVWTNGNWSVITEATALVKTHSAATPDMRYDAYGRNVRGNQMYWDTNRYQAANERVYRQSSSYVDIILKNTMLRSGGSGVDDVNRESIYRFAEAGVQFPTSYEPYMPASVQAFYSNTTIPAGTASPAGDKYLNLTDNTKLVDATIMGRDIRKFTESTSWIVDRAGWYVMYAKCIIINSGADAMWFNWRVTQSAGTFDLSKSGVGRSNVWETDNMIMRYLQRDDVVTCFLVSGAANAASHGVNDIMIAIARLN